MSSSMIIPPSAQRYDTARRRAHDDRSREVAERLSRLSAE